MRTRYLDTLASELERVSRNCGALDTIFIGGGTPTHFTVSELSRLMDVFGRFFQFGANHEFTVEGNPGSITREKVRVFLDGGVNRFSIGVQSFSAETRRRIGRDGEVSWVYRAVDALRDQGVDNFNCDLIYGAPLQTTAEWELDLREIVRLEPLHVSTYSLIVEPDTPLALRGVNEADDDLLVEMWQLAEDILLDQCGLERYEVSNFARNGHHCRHNVDIWKGGRFCGAGPAACYFDGTSRWTNPSDLDEWIAQAPPVEDYLPPDKRAVEILATGLRTVAGWQTAEFQQCTGMDIYSLCGDTLNTLADAGLMSVATDGIRLTTRGLLLADYVERELL